MVVRHLEETGYTVKLLPRDLSEFPQIPRNLLAKWDKPMFIPPTVGPFTLRPHQLQQAQDFLAPNRLLPYCGVIKSGTRTGKSITLAAILAAVNAPSLVLVHGNALQRQLYDTLCSCFGSSLVGMITSNDWDPRLFTIASVRTLANRIGEYGDSPDVQELIQGMTLVACDEVHRATSKGWSSVLKAIPSPMRLGLSGTPLKLEDDRDMTLVAVVGPVIHEFDTAAAQAQGLVAHATLTALYVRKPRFWEMTWQDAKQILIIQNTWRTRLVAMLVSDRIRKGLKTLVMAGNSIPLCHSMAAALEKELMGSEYSGTVAMVTGEMDGEEVIEIFKDFGTGKYSALCTTVLADEGLDFPSVNVLAVVGGGKSFVKTIQRIGRGLMLKMDGSPVEVIEVMDLNNKYLLKHAQERINHYESEKLFSDFAEVESEDILPYVGALNAKQAAATASAGDGVQ